MTTTNKKKSAATETDYFIDIENLKKERNALKQELAELRGGRGVSQNGLGGRQESSAITTKTKSNGFKLV